MWYASVALSLALYKSDDDDDDYQRFLYFLERAEQYKHLCNILTTEQLDQLILSVNHM